jgi:hypothetical protein
MLHLWFTSIIVADIVSKANNMLVDHSDLEIILQFIDLLSIIILPANVSILSPTYIIFNLIVLIYYFLRLFDDLCETLVPVARLGVLVRLFIIEVNFLNYKWEN